MNQALVDQLRAYGQDPNVRHFLDVVIPGAEGTTQHGYYTAFGGGRLDDITDHPRYLKPFKQTDGKTNYTSAAGKYQFLSNTWDETAKALGLSDFGPESQDLGALYLLHQRGVLPDLQKGDFKTAVNKTGSVWASLPSSTYPQPKQSQGFIDSLVSKMIPAAQAGTLPPNVGQSRPTSFKSQVPIAPFDGGYLPEGVAGWLLSRAGGLNELRQDFAARPNRINANPSGYAVNDFLIRANEANVLSDGRVFDSEDDPYDFEKFYKQAQNRPGNVPSTPRPQQSQGTTAMNTTQPPQSALPNARGLYNPEDPVSVYNFITANQQNVPVQQLTPEQKQMLMADRQQRAGMLPMALAASLAGDKRVSGMGSALAEEAMKARGPQRLGNAGWITEDGTVIKDPFQEEESDQRRKDTALNLALQTSNTQALRRLATENTFTQAGKTPDGKPVVSNRTGQTYVVESGPNGPSYTPYSQNIIPTGTYDKNVQAVQEALGSVRRSDAILAQVEKNPEAFGMVAQGVSRLPQFAQGRAAEILLPPETMKARTDVLRSAAQEISSLYGAALSLGEQARANTFIPNQDDPPQVVIQKLKAARDWAHATTQNYGPGVLRDAQGRSTMPTPQAGPQSPAAGGETRKTINGKNYVNRGGQWFEE